MFDKFKEFKKNRKNNDGFDFSFKPRKRIISIPYKIQNYIIKKCSNKSTGGNDGIWINYLFSQINDSLKLRRKHRFIKIKFGKPYKLF